jgi:hypothetical protein
MHVHEPFGCPLLCRVRETGTWISVAFSATGEQLLSRRLITKGGGDCSRTPAWHQDTQPSSRVFSMALILASHPSLKHTPHLIPNPSLMNDQRSGSCMILKFLREDGSGQCHTTLCCVSLDPTRHRRSPSLPHQPSNVSSKIYHIPISHVMASTQSTQLLKHQNSRVRGVQQKFLSSWYARFHLAPRWQCGTLQARFVPFRETRQAGQRQSLHSMMSGGSLTSAECLAQSPCRECMVTWQMHFAIFYEPKGLQWYSNGWMTTYSSVYGENTFLKSTQLGQRQEKGFLLHREASPSRNAVVFGGKQIHY